MNGLDATELKLMILGSKLDTQLGLLESAQAWIDSTQERLKSDRSGVSEFLNLSRHASDAAAAFACAQGLVTGILAIQPDVQNLPATVSVSVGRAASLHILGLR